MEPSFKPASEAQRMWLNSRAELMLGGGSVGSLKTSTALIDGSVEYDNSNVHTIMFRKILAEDSEAIRISQEWFANTGAVLSENEALDNGTGEPNFNGNSHIWRWPWGSTFQFACCTTDNDVYAHQTQSYTCILWDESTRTLPSSWSAPVRHSVTSLKATFGSVLFEYASVMFRISEQRRFGSYSARV